MTLKLAMYQSVPLSKVPVQILFPPVHKVYPYCVQAVQLEVTQLSLHTKML